MEVIRLSAQLEAVFAMRTGGFEDHATRHVNYESTSGQSLKVDIEYPNSRGLLEIFKIIDGKIARIEGVSVFLPYYIEDLWK